MGCEDTQGPHDLSSIRIMIFLNALAECTTINVGFKANLTCSIEIGWLWPFHVIQSHCLRCTVHIPLECFADLISAKWSLEAMHTCNFVALFFHLSESIENDFTLIALYQHLKHVEKLMEIFDNMWISWIAQLIGLHHKGALKMEYLFELQSLLPLTGVMFQYMNLMAATYIGSENQRHVCLIFRIDSVVLRTAFDKHWDSEEYVTWCHFNVTCTINLVAALFVSSTTHICLMESELPISISPYCKWLAAEVFKENREIMIYDCLSITLEIVGRELQSPLQKMSKVVHTFSLIVSDQLDTTFMKKVDYGTPIELFSICIYERGAIFQQGFSYVARLFALLKRNLDFSSRSFSPLIPSMASVDVQLIVYRILHDWALQIRGHASNPIFTTKGYPHVVLCIIVDGDKGYLDIIFRKAPAPLIIWDSDDSHHEKSGSGEIQDISFVMYGREWRPILREVHLIGWLLGDIIAYSLCSARLCVQIVGTGDIDIDTRHLNSCQQRFDDIAMWKISLAASDVGAVAQKISPFKSITTIFVGTNDAFRMFEGHDLWQFFKTILPGPNKLNGLLNGDAQEYVGDWRHKQEGMGVDTWTEMTFNDDHVSNVSRSTVGNELTFVISVYTNAATSVSDTRGAKQFLGVIFLLGIGWLFKVITSMVQAYTILLHLNIFGTSIQKLMLEMCMVQFENGLLSFPNCSMFLSRFERLEDKPHLKQGGVVRTIWLGHISSPSAHTC